MSSILPLFFFCKRGFSLIPALDLFCTKHKSTLLEQEMWDILFLSGCISDTGMDYSCLFFSFCFLYMTGYPSWDRYSKRSEDKKEAGMIEWEWCSVADVSDGGPRAWVKGYGGDLTLVCTLLYSLYLPCFFHVSTQGQVCPLPQLVLSVWAALYRMWPSSRPVLCLIDFRGMLGGGFFLFCFLHTHGQPANS